MHQRIDFQRYLQPRRTGFDPVPFVDLLFIFLFFTLNSAAFVFPPGIGVELPGIRDGAEDNLRIDAVLTVREGGILLFDGALHTPESIARALGGFVDRSPVEHPTLLLKMHHTSTLDEFALLINAAREAGFASVQLAGDVLPGDPSPTTFRELP